MAIADRFTISNALKAFENLRLREAACNLLKTLGYSSDRSLLVPNSSPQSFLELFSGSGTDRPLDQEKALVAEWKAADLLFQLTDQELSRESRLFTEISVKAGLLQSYIFIAIEMKKADYPRGNFSAITRQINRIFPMPVMVFFKHQNNLTIAVINRRLSKVDQSKDVLGKVTLIRAIDFASPHPGHLDILASMALSNLVHPQKKPIRDFDTLHTSWEQIFNIELLNARFYRELANWYFWALPQVDFPADIESDSKRRRATGLIRLLTRLIFCWFLKEKGLIPESLFDETDVGGLLTDLDCGSSSYYLAILQNLFFATLNQRMGKNAKGSPYRTFAVDEGPLKNRSNYDVNNLYRYKSLFREPSTALFLFEDIPFLNGGLFECLDRTEDGTNKKSYLDGFSRIAEKRPSVPNRLFFGGDETVNLADTYGDSKRRAENVSGLLRILKRYKFTIVENTPIDQEIALDPELLGKVFENLLASYNEETKTTARKQTGSFYTPRPIVDYMVDESLKAHLTRALMEKAGMKESDARAGLDLLFTYTEKEHVFSKPEVDCLVASIDTLKVLDPACGSGAFPMGVLHKLVYILGKLDPNNGQWKQTQLAKLDSAPMREELWRTFQDNNDDYGRKLCLIENCLYGVDIQPIAIQITKLRFFISLVCDQRTNRNKKENHGIRPLPNLETNFVAADTLKRLPVMEENLFLVPRVREIEAEIETLYHSHFLIQRRDLKISLQRKIKALRSELANILAVSLVSPAKSKHIADWDPFDPQSSADFFDPHWMFGRALSLGFDVIIGNPPYFKENDDKDRFNGLRVLECYQGKMDVWYLFVDVGLDILKQNGVLSFIATNNWVTNAGASKIRNKILKATRLSFLIDFQDYMIFESASIQTMIMLLIKCKTPSHYKASIAKASSSFSKEDIYKLQSGSSEESANLKSFTVEIIREDLFDKPLLFNSAEKSTILENIAAKGEMVLLKSEIAQGIVPNPDRVNSRNIKTIGERIAEQRGVRIGDGVFVLNMDEQKAIKGADRKHLKPLYEPIHIDKYQMYDTDLSIIYTKRGHFVPEKSSSILAHLSRFREIMEARRENQTGQIEFYNLHWPREESIFERGEKILAPRKCTEPMFCHTIEPAYVMLSMNVIKTTRLNMRYLSAVLNSSVIKYWLRYQGSMQGLNYQIDAAPLQRIPIAKETIDIQNDIGSLVELAKLAHKTTGSNHASSAAFLKDLIDACVMECYFREHMAERDLLFHKVVARYLVDFDHTSNESKQGNFLSDLFQTLNAPTHVVRNRLLRITADSPDLLAIIKGEGRV